jgi:hypothetical protein
MDEEDTEVIFLSLWSANGRLFQKGSFLRLKERCLKVPRMYREICQALLDVLQYNVGLQFMTSPLATSA